MSYVKGKSMKKILTTITVGTMTMTLTACSFLPSNEEEAVIDSEYKVAVITDSRDITDGSYNQIAYEAANTYCEENEWNFTYKIPEEDSDSARADAIKAAIEEGYNVIVMPDSIFAQALIDTAPMYEDVKFVALDMPEEVLYETMGDNEVDLDNVFLGVYRNEKSGYMAGYIAVMMGYKKLGFLGEKMSTSMNRYGYGFVQGANDAAVKLGIYDVEIRYAYTSDTTRETSISTTLNSWYSEGTEVVFAAGDSIQDVVASSAKKANGKMIGSGLDRSIALEETYGSNLLITSAIKRPDVTVQTILSAINNETWKENYAGMAVKLGLVSSVPEENYVSLADTTKWNSSFTSENYITLVADMNAEMIETTKLTGDGLASSFATSIQLRDEGVIQ